MDWLGWVTVWVGLGWVTGWVGLLAGLGYCAARLQCCAQIPGATCGKWPTHPNAVVGGVPLCDACQAWHVYMKGLRSVRGKPKPKGVDDVSWGWVGLVWFGLGWVGCVGLGWVGLAWCGVADKPAHAAARCLYMKVLRSARGKSERKGGDDVSFCWVGLG